MKYSIKNSGELNIGGKATDNGRRVFGNIITKLFGKEPKAEENNKDRVEGGLEGNSNLSWEIEASAEISIEEMAELFKISKENDLHMWDLLKVMGSDLVKGSKKVLEALKEQGPEWIKTIGSLEDLDSEVSTENDIKSFKRHQAAEKEKTVKDE